MHQIKIGPTGWGTLMEFDIPGSWPVRVNVNSVGGIEVVRASGRGDTRFRGPYGGWYADDERAVEGLPASSEAYETDGEVARRWTWHGAINYSGFVSARRRDDRGGVVRFSFDLSSPDYTAATSDLLEQERQRFATL